MADERWSDGAWLEALWRAGGRWPEPPRPRLPEALAAVTGQADPRQAWATLSARGLMPPSWVEGAARRFHLRPSRVSATRRDHRHALLCEAERLPLCASPGVPGAPCGRCPATVSDAARFAADAPGVEAAEALGLAAAGQLWALGQGSSALAAMARAGELQAARLRPVWSAVDEHEARYGDLRLAPLLLGHIADDLGPGWAGLVPAALRAPLGSHLSGWPTVVIELVGYHLWKAAAAAGARVGAGRAGPGVRLHPEPSAVGLPYASLANPFEPLLGVRALGYALRALSPGAVVLGATLGEARKTRAF